MDLYKIYNNYGLYRNFQSLLMLVKMSSSTENAQKHITDSG